MSVAFRSVAFRPLVTAGAAGVMLCGLCFIPSAHGVAPRGETPHRDGRATVSAGAAGAPGSTGMGPAAASRPSDRDSADAGTSGADTAGSGSSGAGSSDAGTSGGAGSGTSGGAGSGSASHPGRSADFAGQNARESRQLALGEPAPVDATPYVVGGAGALCVGAAFATRSMRRGDREAPQGLTRKA